MPESVLQERSRLPKARVSSGEVLDVELGLGLRGGSAEEREACDVPPSGTIVDRRCEQEQAEAVERALRNEKKCAHCSQVGKVARFSGMFCSHPCIQQALGLDETTHPLVTHWIAGLGQCEKCGGHTVQIDYEPAIGYMQTVVYAKCQCGALGAGMTL